MTGKGKKVGKELPPGEEAAASSSARDRIIQKQGEDIEGLKGLLGVRDNGLRGNAEAVAVETGLSDGDATAQSRRYPYGFGQDQARIELTQLAFNPKDSKLAQFTETPRAQVQPTAALEAYDIYIGNMQKMAVLQWEAATLKKRASDLEKEGRDAGAVSSLRDQADGLLAQAEAIYEPMESIFIRCRDKRMLSVSRRSRMEILKFNEVQQERQQAQEGQEAGF